MRHLYRNIALILVVLFLCVLSLWPPEKTLRLGKDLAGGVSLIYLVELAPGDSPDVVDQVIQVLSQRVNPNGLLEISFVKQGRDRIEISMPLPTSRVQELRRSLDAAIREVGAFELDAGAVERALRAPAGEREALLAAMMDTEARRSLLTPVVEALAASGAARAAYEAERTSAAPDRMALDSLVDLAGAADEALENAKRRALMASVSSDEVRAILRRSRVASTIMDDRTKQRITVASPFDKGVQSLRDRLGSVAGGAEAMDALLAAHEAYTAEADSLDDPADLERMLQGSGVLEFRIAVRPGARTDEASLREQLHARGPSGVQAQGVRWFSVNKAEDWFDTVDQLAALEANPAQYFAGRFGIVGDVYAGEYFLLLYDEPGKRLTGAEGNWRLTSATQGADQFGRPSVNFRMDPAGGTKLAAMTEPNINEPMAVMLDGRVFTAPNINSRLSRDVMIEGTFSAQEIAYLQATLRAGSLSARLSERPLSSTRLAPELGRDNLEKGVRAGVIALVLVCAFMTFYYFLSGVVASIALVCNAIIILGVMSLNNAAFTLPGIAGVILTFGMAVDSNVLIYERLREEMLAGNDVRTAIRKAYARAMDTIVDSNVTTLITCVVLAFAATQEIKGFAITLGIGVVATMFSALLVTRVIFVLMVEKWGVKRLRQLPMVIPAIDRFFSPRIDWLRLRPLLWGVSALFIGIGVFFVVVEGEELLDTEFRGGTAVDLRLRAPEPGRTVTFRGEPFTGTLQIAAVREALQEIADEAGAAGDSDPRAAALAELSGASVIAVGESDGITSDWFRVKTTVADERLVVEGLMTRFAEVVGSLPPVQFAGSTAERLEEAPVHLIEEPVLGENQWLGRAEVRDDVAEFVGGVAIVLSGIDPPVRQTELVERLSFVRSRADAVSRTVNRTVRVVVVDGSAEAVEHAVILVRDPSVHGLFDVSSWQTGLAPDEWSFVRAGMTQETTMISVESFSSEVAATFRAKAIVAVAISLLLITIYIWVRFGSLRYSLAAIVPTLLDAVAVIGLIAMTDALLLMFPGLSKHGIQPFKIDLGLMAAILTILGYSLNDKIVILDRIRENRGKLPYATRKVVNDSINQTMSRTVMTGGSTLMSIAVMFFIGGEGLASFNYAMFFGIIIGTFSSIAIGAPIVYTRRIPAAARAVMESAEAREQGLVPRDPATTG